MSLLPDFRSALRQLAMHPAVTVAAIASLALGIGGNAAVFSVMDAVLLRSMPVAEPQQLYSLNPNSTRPQRYSYPLYRRFLEAAGAQPLIAMSRIVRLRGVLTPGASLEQVDGQLVSGNFFEVLGLKPALGRLLNAMEDEGLAAQPVAVVNHAFWRERLGEDTGVIGRTLLLNGQRITIVGVAPEGFGGVWSDNRTELWTPLAMQAPLKYAQHYSSHGSDQDKPWLPLETIDWLEIMARAPGGSVKPLEARLNAEFRRSLEQQFGKVSNEAVRRSLLDQTILLMPAGRGFSQLRQRFAAPLEVMMAMVGLVLLIACVNVANLLLARGAARRREIAVRMSLGASRLQLIGQLLTESLLLAALAAGAGLLVAQWGSRLLVAGVLPSDTPIPFHIGIDAKVLAFTTAISVLTVLIFALAPALRATRVDTAGMITAAARTVYGGARWSMANTLVCAQIALSLLLLFGAGLFARSLYNLAHEKLGYDTEQVITASIDPRSGGYTEAQLPELYRRVTERVQALHGVRSASISMCALAVDCESASGVKVAGYQPAPNEYVRSQWSFVDWRYFETVGMRIVAGRSFERADGGSKRLVAVVNQSFANKYFAGRDAIGGSVDRGAGPTEIIGVVQDSRINFVRQAPQPMIYWSMDLRAVFAESLEVRVPGSAEAAISSIRNALAEAEPGLPVDRITVLEQQVGGSLNQERMVAVLTGIFGGLALALACLGLYGVMAHAVARRTPEIGVRMALGATPKQILSGVLNQSLAIVAVGLALGLPLIWAGARAAQSLLYEVKALDVLSLAGALALMSIVGALAAWVPARRAARVDPMAALREQ